VDHQDTETRDDEPSEVTGVDFVLPSALSDEPRDDSGWRFAIAIGLLLLLLIVAGARLAADRDEVARPTVAPADRILPTGPPVPQLLARQDQLALEVPVPQERITGVLFHPVQGTNALRLTPVGPAREQGLFGRIVDAFRTETEEGIGSFREGAPEAVDVGAPIGTEVFTPVDGRILSITPSIIDAVSFGDVIAIEPSANPGVVVVLSGLEADRGLSVGTPVSTRPEEWSKLGAIIDIGAGLTPALSRYTQDGGNRVQIQVLPATAVAAS